MERLTFRIMSLTSTFLLARLAWAVDANPVWSGGWDRIELSSGVVITGRIVGVDGPNLRIDAGFAQIAVERARVLSIQQGAGDRASANRNAPLAVISPQSDSAAPTWCIDLVTTTGIHLGVLESRGEVTDHVTGITQDIAFKQRLDGIDANPAIRAALSHHLAPGSPFSVGLALEHGTASGADLRLGLWSLELTGGWQIADGEVAGASWQAQLGCGWQCASGTQALTLSHGSGSPVDNASIDAVIRGPLARIEAGPSWRLGAWRLEALAGIAWSSLRGSSDWASDHGTYQGSFDYDATIIAMYIGLGVLRTF